MTTIKQADIRVLCDLVDGSSSARVRCVGATSPELIDVTTLFGDLTYTWKIFNDRQYVRMVRARLPVELQRSIRFDGCTWVHPYVALAGLFEYDSTFLSYPGVMCSQLLPYLGLPEGVTGSNLLTYSWPKSDTPAAVAPLAPEIPVPRNKESSFIDQMNALIDIGTSTLDRVASALVGIGAGFKHVDARLTALSDQIAAIPGVKQAEDIYPAYDGPHPSYCAYDMCRANLINMVNHLTRHSNIQQNAIFRDLYFTYAERSGINLYVYRTAYAADREAALGVEVPADTISLIEVAYQLGVLSDIYALAWELTDGGTRRIPYHPYEAIDKEVSPVDLTPRGPRSTYRIQPAWVYAKGPIGKIRKDTPAQAASKALDNTIARSSRQEAGV
jgi:hypothetical protein